MPIPKQLQRQEVPKEQVLIEVDGGVNLETGAQLAQAGADALVAGSFVFGSSDPVATIAALKSL
jgi:ribulose-phosphate 3-epimerase